MADTNQLAQISVLLNGEQAAKEMEVLRQHARELSKAIDEARQAGNNAFANQMTKELREANKQMNTFKKETTDTSKVLANLSTAKPKELRETLSALTTQLNSKKIERGSKEWNVLQESIRKVKQEMQNVAAESEVAGAKVSRSSSVMKAGFGQVVSTLAAITGISFGVKKAIEDYASLTDAYADVQKYTGLTREAVEELNEAFMKMDTRTSRERLNELAGDAGRLGLQTKEAILEFVEAADIINVALGEDLGADAVKNIGKLTEMFGASDEKGLRGGMIATASVINELAQNSSAAEGYLLDFTARMAGTGKQAGILMTDIMGYASVLDQDMQQVEMSATALQGVIMKMYQEPAKFAKMAGKDVSEFTKLLKEDANEAFLQLLSSLSQQGGLEKLSPIFKEMSLDGARASGVLSNLATNVEKIRAEQELASGAYREGTSVINEFNAVNNNEAAALDKKKEAIQNNVLLLGQGLIPYYIELLDYTNNFIKLLTLLPKLLKENWQWLAALSLSIAAYNVELIKSTALKYKDIVVDKLKILWTNRTTIAQNALNFAIRNNPIGLLITAVSLVVAGFISWYNSSIKVQAALQGVFAVIKEFAERYFNVLLSLKDLVLGVFTFNPKLIAEGVTKGRDAIKKAFSSAGDAMAKAYNDAYKKRIREGQKEIENETPVPTASIPGSAVVTPSGNSASPLDNPDKVSEQRKRVTDKLKEVEEKHLQEMSAIKQRYIDQDIKTEEEYLLLLEQQQQDYDTKRKESLTELLKSVTDPSLRLELLKQVAEIEEKGLDRLIALRTKLNRQAEADQKAAVNSEIKALETEMAEREALIAKQHRDGLLTEGAYKEALLKLELEFLQKKAAINGLTPDQAAAIQKDISLNAADTEDNRSSERQKALEKFDLIPDAEIRAQALKEIEDFEARGVLTHDEAMEAKRLIDEQYLEALTGKMSEANEKIQNVTGNLSSAISGFAQAEEMSVTRKYDKMIAAAEGNSAKQKKLEEKKEKELAAIRAKYADKEFIVKAASIGASTAVAAMQAYAAMAGIPIVGPALGAIAAAAAVAAGAAQIAVANQERQNAKQGYASGGYTPSGRWDEPQGVVHSDEFVGNRFAKRNPTVKRVFDVIDQAQRNNTVSALTEKDFAKALNYREAENRATVAGISSAISSASGSETEAVINEELLAWIQQTNEVTERLSQRLNEPIVAEVAITGRNGFEENWNKYQRIVNDAQR